jgi:hypothetical protein
LPSPAVLPLVTEVRAFDKPAAVQARRLRMIDSDAL